MTRPESSRICRNTYVLCFVMIVTCLLAAIVTSSFLAKILLFTICKNNTTIIKFLERLGFNKTFIMISKGCFNSGQKGAFLRQYMEGVVLWLMGNEKNKISLRENGYLAKHFSGKEKPPAFKPEVGRSNWSLSGWRRCSGRRLCYQI